MYYNSRTWFITIYVCYVTVHGSRDSAVDIVTGYGLDDQEVGV
jgi:hypothetical protein